MGTGMENAETQDSFDISDNSENIEKSIDDIRQWIEANSKLNGRSDKQFIRGFLCSCKYDEDRTKQKILRFYQNRQDYPEWLQNRDPMDQKMQDLLQLKLVAVMADQLDDDGNLIFLAKECHYDPRLIDLDLVFKLQMLQLEMFTWNKDIPFLRVVMIGDLKDVSPRFFSYLTPRFVMKFIRCTIGGLPVKFVACHFMNAPRALVALISFAKLFLPTKLGNRVHAHGSDVSVLKKFYPERCLPLEFGGTAGPFQEHAEALIKHIMDQREAILEDSKYGLRK